MAKHWTRTNGIVWEELESKVVLVDPATRTSWFLNATAAFVWKHCNGVAVSELARALSKRGGDELRAIENDMTEFCHRLERAGLLTAAPTPAVIPSGIAGFQGLYSAPALLTRSAGATRRRPSPRGVSGPV